MNSFKKLLAGPQMAPFSNGTEAMYWYEKNCCECRRAYFPGDDAHGEPKDYPSDKTMREYVRIGKECKLKYFLDLAFIAGSIPLSIAEEIGQHGQALNPDCAKFSDEDNDGYQPPRRPPPPPEGDIRQLHLFPLFNPLLLPEKKTESLPQPAEALPLTRCKC